FGRDLEREGFVMLEHGTAVEAETGYAEACEFHRQQVARLSAGIVAGRMVHGTERAVGKGCSIEAGSSLGVLVVPQANCVLGHYLAFRFGKPIERAVCCRVVAGGRFGAIGSPARSRRAKEEISPMINTGPPP